jgi:hypothetical protein
MQSPSPSKSHRKVVAPDEVDVKVTVWNVSGELGV